MVKYLKSSKKNFKKTNFIQQCGQCFCCFLIQRKTSRHSKKDDKPLKHFIWRLSIGLNWSTTKITKNSHTYHAILATQRQRQRHHFYIKIPI